MGQVSRSNYGTFRSPPAVGKSPALPRTNRVHGPDVGVWFAKYSVGVRFGKPGSAAVCLTGTEQFMKNKEIYLNLIITLINNCIYDDQCTVELKC